MKSRPTAVLAFALFCALAFAVPAQATFPGQNGKLVFEREAANANVDLYTVNPDRTDLTQLTSNGGFPFDSAGDFTPKWSPDGSRFVFRRGSPDGFGIFVMNADGSGLKRLSDRRSAAVWSPDGSKLAFLGCIVVPDCGYVSTMNADGTGAQSFVRGHLPVWSEDGRLAFEDDFDGGIYVMNADGTGLARITTGGYPVWGHGGKIAFLRQVGGFTRIFIVNADGTGEIAVPATRGFDFPRDWSPDGTKLLFESTECLSPETGFSCLYTVNPDGSGLTEVIAGDGPAVWSPDGSKIAYRALGGIFTVNRDGSGVTQVTSGAENEHAIDWQPLPVQTPDDNRNPRQLCKAERKSLGKAAFRKKYGRRHALRTCVRGNGGRRPSRTPR